MFNFLIKSKYNKFQFLIQETNKFSQIYRTYSNTALKQQTEKLQSKLQSSKYIDEILAEAFGTAKEAIRRSLGINLFDVQICGGIVLHYGKIAEMKTGEGKTLVAMLPAYLNALANKSVHIITVNEYLANRDAEIASKVYQYLNMEVGIVKQTMTTLERKINYRKNITYITNNELGFDYLRDNMAINKTDLVQTNFNFAIIDEVDSILIDEARTPLIISGPSESPTKKYISSQDIALKLSKKIDYDIDEKAKNIILTEKGIINCETFLKINNLYDLDNPWIPYILNALKAKEFFFRNIHYIIKGNTIVIVDEFTGRIMEGRRWSDGLHQAIEAKENITIQQENQTLASITYQNLFLLYDKLSGMTGTAKTEEAELDKIYKLEVEEIPTNQPCKRKDLPDLVYKKEYNKWIAVANECYDMYKIGRPTLIGTTSVEKSELLAKILDEFQIPYNLLNAKPENIARESEIITQAGRKSAITISTNMAGRGTDIILGGNAEMMSKITLNNYIKNNFNIDMRNFDEKIKNVLNNINTQLISNQLQGQNIGKILEQNISDNSDNIDNIHEKDNISKHIQQIYNQLTNQYQYIFDKEKEEVIKLGGLHVIGTERHESRRIDNQLKGRAGRQGDPGSSRFFLSLEDNLLRIFGGNKISKLMEQLNINDNIPIESIILTKSLDSAQKKVESYFYDVRKQLFEYDEVINSQRQAIYAERKRILESYFTRDCIIEYAENIIDEALSIYNKKSSKEKIKRITNITKLLNLTDSFNINELIYMDYNTLKSFLYEQLRITYDLRESYLEQLRPGLIRQLEKYYLLQQIDKAWQEHIEKMNLLKESIGWRSYGQQDPLVEYKNEAFNLFLNMVTYIRQTVVYLMMRSRLIINNKNR